MNIYLDHNATTPPDERVIEAMARVMRHAWANASSAHARGGMAAEVAAGASHALAGLLGCAPAEIVWTSGGTESLNLAIMGLARIGDTRGHIIASAIEHPAVRAPVRQLEREGHAVTWLGVDVGGQVSPDEVRRALRPDTMLVSVMWANNETGVIQPVAEIGALCREAGVPFVCDAVQAAGKTPVSFRDAQVDLMAVGAHKLRGPKGVGALVVRHSVVLEPVLRGGSQQKGRRPGTLDVPGIAGFGVAADIASDALRTGVFDRVAELRDALISQVLTRCHDAYVIGTEPRLPNTANIVFPETSGEVISQLLDSRGIVVSTASACAAGRAEPSHVLRAVGVPAEELRSAVRFSLGPATTAAEIDEVANVLPGIVDRARNTGFAVESGAVAPV